MLIRLQANPYRRGGRVRVRPERDENVGSLELKDARDADVVRGERLALVVAVKDADHAEAVAENHRAAPARRARGRKVLAVCVRAQT